MDPASLLSSLEPVSLLFGVVAMGLAHFSHDAEIRYDAGCWSTMAWIRCHRENFGNLHTDKSRAAIKSGHNISVTPRHAKKG